MTTSHEDAASREELMAGLRRVVRTSSLSPFAVAELSPADQVHLAAVAMVSSLNYALESMPARSLHPILAAAQKVPTWTVETAAVTDDGRQVLYNPTSFLALPPAQRVSRCAHEAGHVAFRHAQRQQWRQHEKWNLACDILLNRLLVRLGFPRIATWAWDLPEERWQWLTPEDLYDRMPNEPPSGYQPDMHGGPPQPMPDGLSVTGTPLLNGNGNGAGQQGSGKGTKKKGKGGAGSGKRRRKRGKDANGQGGGAGGSADQAAIGSAAGPSDPERVAAAMDAAMQLAVHQAAEALRRWVADHPKEAAQAGRGAGLGVGTATALDLARVPGTAHDWRSEVSSWVGSRPGYESTWSRPSRRSHALGVYLPGRRRGRPSAAVIIDGSGSIADKIHEMMGDLHAILEALGYDVRVLMHDSRVYYDGVVESVDDLPGASRGGTRFGPVFDRLREDPTCGGKIEAPDVAVWCTDLDAYDKEWHGLRLPYELIWVAYEWDEQSIAAMPFGRVIRMEASYLAR